jgi:hypothetical protein
VCGSVLKEHFAWLWLVEILFWGYFNRYGSWADWERL